MLKIKSLVAVNAKNIIIALTAYIAAQMLRISNNFDSELSDFTNYFYKVLTITLVIVIFYILKESAQLIPKTNKLPQRFHVIDKVLVIFTVYIIENEVEKAINALIPGKSKNQLAIENNVHKQGFVYSLTDIGIGTPIIEEIIYRGILLAVISSVIYLIFKDKKYKNVLIAITFVSVSGVLFGFAHVKAQGDYQHIFTYLLSGLFYATVYIVTKNLLYPIILHMFNNIPSLLIFSEKIGVTEDTIMIAYFIVGLMFVIMIICCAIRIPAWNRYSQK